MLPQFLLQPSTSCNPKGATSVQIRESGFVFTGLSLWFENYEQNKIQKLRYLYKGFNGYASGKRIFFLRGARGKN